MSDFEDSTTDARLATQPDPNLIINGVEVYDEFIRYKGVNYFKAPDAARKEAMALAISAHKSFLSMDRIVSDAQIIYNYLVEGTVPEVAKIKTNFGGGA